MKKTWFIPFVALLAFAAGCKSDANTDPADAPAPGATANTAAEGKGAEAAAGPEPTPGPGISGAESRAGSKTGG